MTLTDWMAEVRGRLSDIAPGKWYKDRDFPEIKTDVGSEPNRIIAVCYLQKVEANLNANFIAHAPQDLETALRALEIAREALDQHLVCSCQCSQHARKAVASMDERVRKGKVTSEHSR